MQTFPSGTRYFYLSVILKEKNKNNQSLCCRVPPIWQGPFWALHAWTYAILGTALRYNYPQFLVEENEKQKSNVRRVTRLVSKEAWMQTQVAGSSIPVRDSSMPLSPENTSTRADYDLGQVSTAFQRPHCHTQAGHVDAACVVSTGCTVWAQECTCWCLGPRSNLAHVPFVFGSFMRAQT